MCWRSVYLPKAFIWRDNYSELPSDCLRLSNAPSATTAKSEGRDGSHPPVLDSQSWREKKQVEFSADAAFCHCHRILYANRSLRFSSWMVTKCETGMFPEATNHVGRRRATTMASPNLVLFIWKCVAFLGITHTLRMSWWFGNRVIGVFAIAWHAKQKLQLASKGFLILEVLFLILFDYCFWLVHLCST